MVKNSKFRLGTGFFRIQHTQIRLKSLVPNFYSKMPLELYRALFFRKSSRLIHIMTIPTKKQLRNECERAKRAESFVYLHRKHTIFSIFRYNDVLVLFNLYGRNYKIYKTPKINPPPVYATNDFNWKCGTSYRLSSEDIYFFIFSSSHPPPPAPVTLSFISLSPSLPLPHLGPPPFLNLLCRLLFLPFSFLTCLKSVP